MAHINYEIEISKCRISWNFRVSQNLWILGKLVFLLFPKFFCVYKFLVGNNTSYAFCLLIYFVYFAMWNNRKKTHMVYIWIYMYSSTCIKYPASIWLSKKSLNVGFNWPLHKLYKKAINNLFKLKNCSFLIDSEMLTDRSFHFKRQPRLGEMGEDAHIYISWV